MDVINAWQDVIGSENVLIDQPTLRAAQTATFATTQQVLAVIRPGSREEIQACVKLANQYRVPIYPVSCGKNWGLGSRVPTQSDCVIMELGRLNKILEYDEKLAYVVVEPGVTFHQLAVFLRRQNSNLCVSDIGGSPAASLIGNTIERGDGSGYYGERLNYACDFEVVLPTGELIHTGLGRFENSQAAKLHRWGVGPYLDGIFTQSNLGIVTKMTMWLMPAPNFYQSIRCRLKDYSQLEKLIDVVQKLALQGVFKSNGFGFWNCYKFLARQGRYPWRIAAGKTFLSLKESYGLEPWFGTGELYSASREIGLAERKIIESAFKGLVSELEFTDSDCDRNLIQEHLLDPPKNTNVRSTYWRKKHQIPIQMNPDRDGCGVVWLCPVLPFDGCQVIEALEIIESTVKSYHFEPNVAMTCSSGRSIRMFLAIMYDREVPGEDERAMECHDLTLQLLSEKGYLPYRLGIQSMNSLPPVQDDYGHLISTLKKGLDPNNVLSPGRYDFRQEWSPKIPSELNLNSMVYH